MVLTKNYLICRTQIDAVVAARNTKHVKAHQSTHLLEAGCIWLFVRLLQFIDVPQDSSRRPWHFLVWRDDWMFKFIYYVGILQNRRRVCRVCTPYLSHGRLSELDSRALVSSPTLLKFHVRWSEGCAKFQTYDVMVEVYRGVMCLFIHITSEVISSRCNFFMLLLWSHPISFATSRRTVLHWALYLVVKVLCIGKILWVDMQNERRVAESATKTHCSAPSAPSGESRIVRLCFNVGSGDLSSENQMLRCYPFIQSTLYYITTSIYII